MGIKSLVDWDRAIYSTSVVLKATSGQAAKVMAYPVHDLTEEGSSAVEEVHAPAKSAST